MKTATAMKDVPQEALAALGMSTLGVMGLLYVVLLIIVRACCLTKLWAWFVVPLGLPALGILAAIGLTMTLSVLLGLHRLESKITVLQSLCGVLMTTGLGWCIHLFM
jgi:hypothetical protein